MAGFTISMLVVGLLTKILNGTLLLNVKYTYKIFAVCALSISAFSLIALASYHEPNPEDKNPPSTWFVVAVLASSLVGFGQGLGEATVLGFLKGFPSFTVGYVSSGTGFAGLNCIGL
jgi:uncharacterized membrane protein YhhN